MASTMASLRCAARGLATGLGQAQLALEEAADSQLLAMPAGWGLGWGAGSGCNRGLRLGSTVARFI